MRGGLEPPARRVLTEMAHVDLWIATLGGAITITVGSPPFVARYPTVAPWLNYLGGVLSAVGSIFALIATFGTPRPATAAMMMMRPDSDPRIRSSLLVARGGAALLVPAAIASIWHDGFSIVAILAFVVGVCAFVRTSLTLGGGTSAVVAD
jgi:hypothetical protein